MRLLLCVSCLLGFASLSTLKAADADTTAAPLSPVTIPVFDKASNSPAVPQKQDSLPTTGPTAVVKSSDKPPTASPVPSGSSTSASVLPKPVSSPGLGGSTGTSPPGILTPLSSKSTEASVSVSPSSLSAAPATLPPSSNSRATASSVTKEPPRPSVVPPARLPATSANPSTPGSTSTERSVTTAVSQAPTGLTAPSPVQETVRTTPRSMATDAAFKATSTASEASTKTTPSTPAVDSATTIKSVKIPTARGYEPTISSSPLTNQASGSHSTARSETVLSPGIKVICSSQDFANKSLIVQEKKSISCNEEMVRDHKALLVLLCESVKSGFKFNENTDECNVQLGSSKEHPNKLAVLEVSVKTNAGAKDIDENLKSKKEELAKLGFLLANDTGAESEAREDYEDKLSIPLIITIVCLAAALLLIAAIYSCCHQRQRHKKDQRLTEELQTMENGYHDNPTLEVMETSPEMQEKKPGLNGDLGDSWIVPMDNLTKEDLDEEEEDTHL